MSHTYVVPCPVFESRALYAGESSRSILQEQDNGNKITKTIKNNFMLRSIEKLQSEKSEVSLKFRAKLGKAESG